MKLTYNRLFSQINIRILRRNLRKPTLIILVLVLLAFFWWCDYTGVLKNRFALDLSDLERYLNESSRPDVNEHKLNYSYVHKAEQTCAQRAPFLLILVKSRASNFEHRIAIRQTWARTDPLGVIKRVFLVGLPENQSTTHLIDAEHRLYSDIVQKDFYDTYNNNTLKTLMGIRWAYHYCPKAKFYLFIDDDFYLNPNQMVSLLLTNTTINKMYETLYAGFVYKDALPMRHKSSKWYISLGDYPFGQYPPYAIGGCFLLSPTSLRLFVSASRLLKMFIIDDVYLGMIAYKLDIRPLHIESIFYEAPVYEPDLYAYEVSAAHDFTARQLMNMWVELESAVSLKPTSYEQFFTPQLV